MTALADRMQPMRGKSVRISYSFIRRLQTMASRPNQSLKGIWEAAIDFARTDTKALSATLQNKAPASRRKRGVEARPVYLSISEWHCAQVDELARETGYSVSDVLNATIAMWMVRHNEKPSTRSRLSTFDLSQMQVEPFIPHRPLPSIQPGAAVFVEAAVLFFAFATPRRTDGKIWKSMNEAGLSPQCTRLVAGAQDGDISLHTTSFEFTRMWRMFYAADSHQGFLAPDGVGKEKRNVYLRRVRLHIAGLIRLVNVVPIDGGLVTRALAISKHKSLESGIFLTAALRHSIIHETNLAVASTDYSNLKSALHTFTPSDISASGQWKSIDRAPILGCYSPSEVERWSVPASESSMFATNLFTPLANIQRMLRGIARNLDAFAPSAFAHQLVAKAKTMSPIYRISFNEWSELRKFILSSARNEQEARAFDKTLPRFRFSSAFGNVRDMEMAEGAATRRAAQMAKFKRLEEIAEERRRMARDDDQYMMPLC